MIVFSPAPRCKPGVQRLVEPMTAACYLRLRRARSGLSRRDLAYRLSSAVQPHYLVSPAARIPALDEAMALIDMLETDGARARYRWTVEALAAFIPMDVDVYHQLANDPEERHPQVCRGCACTEGDIASSGWAVANLCVSCLKRDAALAEVR